MLSTDVKNLIHGILEVNISLRLTTARIIEHPWMKLPSPAPSVVNSSVNNSIAVTPGGAVGLKPGGPSRSEAPQTVSGGVYAVVAVPNASATTNADAASRRNVVAQPMASATSNVARIDLSIGAAVADGGLSQNNSARSREATAGVAVPAAVRRAEGPEVRLDRARNTTRLNVLLTGGKIPNDRVGNWSASTVDEGSEDEGAGATNGANDWDMRNRSNNHGSRSSTSNYNSGNLPSAG